MSAGPSVRSALASACANVASLSAAAEGTSKRCPTRTTSGASKLPSASAMTTIGARRRVAVGSSESAARNPSPPVKQTTRRSGWTRWAAIAAGSANPVVAGPYEARNSPGATASQDAATAAA